MITFHKPNSGGTGVALSVDGEEIPYVDFHMYSGDRGWVVTITGAGRLHFLHQKLADLPEDVAEFRLDPRGKRLPEVRLVVVFFKTAPDRKFSIKLEIRFSVQRWKKPWSMGELRDEVKLLTRDGFQELFWDEARISLTGFAIAVRRFEENLSFGQLIDEWTKAGEAILEEAERRLLTRLKPDTLIALFDFPATVRTACEQYLLFFADFLRTLGINAEADLVHESGRVLFSVKPGSGREALEQIREALEIYLELPLAQTLGDLTQIKDPRVQQLQATIDHLKSQISYANAITQLKDATIQQLTLTVQTQAAVLTPQVLQSSLRAVATSKENGDEELFDGIVKLKKYDGKWFQIDLPEIFRRFKAMGFGAPNRPDATVTLEDSDVEIIPPTKKLEDRRREH